MSFICFRCNHVATNKYNLERHLKNKKICKAHNEMLESFQREDMLRIIKNDENILKESKDILDFQERKIDFQDKTIKLQMLKIESQDKKILEVEGQIKSQDKKILEVETKIQKELGTKIVELETKIKKLEKENSQKQEIINSYNTHINSHNTTINNHYHTHTHNITLNMIFEEDTWMDQPTHDGKDNTYEFLKKKVGYIFSWPNEAFERMVKLIHFNDDFPENHNMYMSSKRDGWFRVYGLNKINKETTWCVIKKKEFLKLYVKERYKGTFDNLIGFMDEKLKKDNFWQNNNDIRINQYKCIKKYNKMFRDNEDTKKEFQAYMRHLEGRLESVCIEEFDKQKEQQKQQKE